MHELAGVHVEKRAVFELISHAEQQMDMVIMQSKRELEKRNGLCGIQGIKPRARIDGECVRKAIKAISNDTYPSTPGMAGGIKEKGEKDDKHPPKNEKDQGAEIT